MYSISGTDFNAVLFNNSRGDLILSVSKTGCTLSHYYRRNPRLAVEALRASLELSLHNVRNTSARSLKLELSDSTFAEITPTSCYINTREFPFEDYYTYKVVREAFKTTAANLFWKPNQQELLG